MLDGLEEQRPHNNHEIIFRRPVKQHLDKRLEAQRIYWKQRNTTRWVKFGDENTLVFQAMATFSLRRNYIVSLNLPNGSTLTDHDRTEGWSFMECL